MKTLATALLIALAALTGCAGAPRSPALNLHDSPRASEELSSVFAGAGIYTRVLDDISLVVAHEEHTERNVVVFIEDDGASLQALLTCPWRPEVVDPARIAAWNATHRFCHAYLDDENHPVLAADLALDETVTRHTVVEWGRLVLELADAFAAEVWPAR